MARDFIKVATNDSAATFSGELIRFKELVRQVIDQGEKVKGIMDRNHDGTVFTDLEALFGLPATKGQIVYNLVNGTVGVLKGTFQNADALTLIDRVG